MGSVVDNHARRFEGAKRSETACGPCSEAQSLRFKAQASREQRLREHPTRGNTGSNPVPSIGPHGRGRPNESSRGMSRSWGTPQSVREGEGLPHGEETAVSGFKSRLVHWVASYRHGTNMSESKVAEDMVDGTRQERKQHRVATKSHLHELGFIGVRVTMDARDYALIDLSDVPRKRKMVAEVYFENTDPYHREPDIEGYQWGVEV